MNTRTRDWYAIGAGIRAVLALFLGAVDALVSAVLGIPPIRWCAAHLAEVIRAEYWRGRFGPPSDHTDLEPVVVDAEIVDEEPNQ